MSRETELQKIQQRYLETIALVLRPSTVVNARTATNSFIGYLEEQQPDVSSFAELERRHIEGWLRYLAQRPLKRSTRRNQIIKVRRFLETLQDLGWKEAPRTDLFHRGDLPPEDKSLPRPLSHDTDQALQNELRERGGMIHKALLLMRSTGLRRQEMLDLKVESLRSLPGREWALHVPLGKLHDERVIPMDRETTKIFEEMLKLRGSPPPVRDPETGKPAQFLLTLPNGRRFSGDAFRYHLGKIQKEIGLGEHPTPHRLRHSYATEMLRAGISLPILMKLLGHRSIGMTLRYAKVTGMDVRRAYVETIAVIEKRYEIPSLPAKPRCSAGKLSSWGSVASHLEAFAREIESLRRDHAAAPQRKRAQRLVERLRRLAADFENLTS
jgi:site-specific recombinase XerD